MAEEPIDGVLISAHASIVLREARDMAVCSISPGAYSVHWGFQVLAIC